MTAFVSSSLILIHVAVTQFNNSVAFTPNINTVSTIPQLQVLQMATLVLLLASQSTLKGHLQCKVCSYKGKTCSKCSVMDMFTK